MNGRFEYFPIIRDPFLTGKIYVSQIDLLIYLKQLSNKNNV